MVKANDTSDAMLSPSNDITSSMDSEGSFVVLSRTTAPELSTQPFPNGAPSMGSSMASSGFPLHALDSHNSSLMQSPFPSDLQPEDIQRKLRDLVQENVDLKETLHQNNLAMRQQFNTLMLWRNEVNKVHVNHREKFQETKEIIIKLQAENVELKNFLESKSGSISDAQLKAENAELKGRLAELQQKLSVPVPRVDNQGATPSKKEIELNELAKQLNHQLETAERARRKLSMDVERLNAQNARADNEISTLRKELEDKHQKYLVQEQMNMELTQKLKQCEKFIQEGKAIEEERAKHTQEVQQLKTELEKQRGEVQNLKDELNKEKEKKQHLIGQLNRKEELAQGIQSKEVGQNNDVNTSEQLSEASSEKAKKSGNFSTYIESCEEKLDILNSSLIKQTERYVVLDRWLQNATLKASQMRFPQSSDAQILQGLKLEIQELRKILAQEQAYSVEKKINLNETQKCFQQLFTDYQSLLVEWESFHEEQKDKARHNDVYHDTQARGFIERLDRLTAEVLCKDEEIKENDKEIKQLKDKVKKLEVDNEAISILKAQVEVYQSDFNAEREARENLAGEKERLSEDLRHLQRRNQQLLDELETYQRNQFDQMQVKSSASGWSTIATPGRSSASPNGKTQQQPVEPENPSLKVFDEDVPPPKEYICPVCKMAFRLLEHLEYHIETCLDG